MARKENGIYVVSDKLNVERYNIEGNIYSVIEELNNIREIAVDMGMVGEGDLDISIESGYYDDAYVVITYCFDRVENEKEKTIREKVEALERERAAAKRKATAEKKKLKADAEYTEFLRLKEKFGAI